MHRFTLACVFLALAACTASPAEPTGSSSVTVGSPTLTEYVHLFNHSRFAIGSPTYQKSEASIDKVIGDWGVFGTDQKTRSVLALPNADAPSRARPALTTDPAVHNAAVRKYFVDAGLPADEVDSVSVHTMASASGAGSDPPTSWEFEAYTSTISRQYDGVRVVESHAWAQFNDLGEVVTESVYWPEVSKSVAMAATAFRKQLEDPAAKAAFFAKVPEGGRLVIHHTPAAWKGTFSAMVSYDVGGFGKTKHYDASGWSFTLPHEG
ncbi:MAG: hypothetical protein IPI67_23470 [Myxococcales bacterium]|nr:hypothetical protein [Myxococcales bacterium]